MRTAGREDGEPSEQATGRAAAWNYAVFAASKATTLVMTVVLARLLTPADFGLFALGLVMLNLFDYVRDLGVAAALVQSPRRWLDLAPTGLTLSTGFGVVMTTAAVLLAPTIAAAAGHPGLAPLVQVLAIALLISSLATLPHSLLRRRMDFRQRLLPEFVGSLVKATVAIGLAAAGHGVWSLVWAQLAGSATTSVLYWVVARPTPRIGFDRNLARGLIRFGLPVTALSLLAFLVTSIPPTVIGRQLGTEQLGYYTLAYRLAELLVINLCVVIGDVLFSALSRFQHRPEVLGQRYLGAVRISVALTTPLGLGMAAVSPDLVALLYGPKYAAVAPALGVLALVVVTSSAIFHAGSVYKAIGRPILLTYLTAGWLVVVAPAVWFAAAHSIVAVGLTLLVAELADLVVRMLVVRSVLGLSVRSQVRVYAGPFGAGAAMTLVVWSAGMLLPAWPPAARLAVLIPVGIACYAGALHVLDRHTLRLLVGFARGERDDLQKEKGSVRPAPG